MREREIPAKPIVPGDAEGEAVVVESLSFYGEVDPETGTLKDGRSVAGKILVIGRTRGSTVGSYIIYALKQNNKAPKAIIVTSKPDPIVITGAILAGIPLYHIEYPLYKLTNDSLYLKIRNNKIIL